MDSQLVQNLIGYIGSAIILSSFMMTSNLKLRIVNMIGSIFSITYSFIIGAYPTAICNICIISINLYYLIKLLNNSSNHYRIVECSGLSSEMYKDFVSKNAADIKKYYPCFQADDKRINFARFIMNNNEIVGLQAGIVKGSSIHIMLDYSTPAYRDYSVGRYAYAHLDTKNIKKVYLTKPCSSVVQYLSDVGFTAKRDQLALNLA